MGNIYYIVRLCQLLYFETSLKGWDAKVVEPRLCLSSSEKARVAPEPSVSQSI
jgi:hypothetical protein